MKSETEIRKALEPLQDDLKYWRVRYEKERDVAMQRIHANTIVGLESQIEILQWILKER